MKNIKNLIVIILLLAFSSSLNAQNNKNTDKSPKAKYVFLFIGDGMGLAHVSLTEAYLAAMDNQIGFKPLTFNQFTYTGLSTTHAQNRLITCSAAAGTALATGSKTSINTISKTYNHADSLYSVAYFAKKQGYKIGILSSSYINDATPCVFYAHADDRDEYYNISQQFTRSNFDVLGGGTFVDPDNSGKSTNILNLLKNAGYTVSKNIDDFNAINNSNKKVFMQSPDCLPDGSMPFAIDQTDKTITLAKFTKKAIELLYNPKGFFMMVEGGKIDWAAHNNDASTIIEEVIDFNNAIIQAIEFYKQHPDETLIVVTADHETGGLALGYDGMRYDSNLKLLSGQKGSIEKFNDTLYNFIEKKGINNFTYSTMLSIGSYFFNMDTTIFKDIVSKDMNEAYNKYVQNFSTNKNKSSKYSFNPLSDIWLEIRNHHAGIDFSTHSHTAIPVPVYAMGVGGEKFTGFYDNTDIPKRIAIVMGIKDFVLQK